MQMPRSAAATNNIAYPPIAVKSQLAAPAPKDCSERTPDSDDGKQPLSLFRSVNIVRKSPELSYQHQIEKSDPKEKHNTKGNLQAAEFVEDDQVGHKKSGYGID
jgi:hypothetical protein